MDPVFYLLRQVDSPRGIMGFADRRIANFKSEQGNDSVVANTAMRGHARGWVLHGAPQDFRSAPSRTPSELPQSPLGAPSVGAPSELPRSSLGAPSELPQSSLGAPLRAPSDLPRSSLRAPLQRIPRSSPHGSLSGRLRPPSQSSLRAPPELPGEEKFTIFITIS